MASNRTSNGWKTDLFRQLAAITAALIVAQLTNGVVQEAAAVLAIGQLPPGAGRGPGRPAP